MIIFPFCKINLGLSVIEKRSDGFHNLETVLYPIQIKDALEIIPTLGKFEFSISGLPIEGNPEQNLVVRAYRMIEKDFNIGPVHIHLHKVIPAGAGIGGGSSDASHTLLLLNKLFSLNLTLGRMENYARQLGSDCAFFLNNKPKLAYEKGDLFKQANVNLESYTIMVVKPNISINTGEAYGWISPSKKDTPLTDILELPVREWEGKLINDFEAPVFERYPKLAEIKAKIRSSGAIYSSLTGSGSAIYGIFHKTDFPEKKIDIPGAFIWVS